MTMDGAVAAEDEDGIGVGGCGGEFMLPGGLGVGLEWFEVGGGGAWAGDGGGSHCVTSGGAEIFEGRGHPPVQAECNSAPAACAHTNSSHPTLKASAMRIIFAGTFA